MICMLTRRWRSSQLTYSIPRKFRGLIQYLIVLDQLLNSSTGLNWKPQSILIQISSKQKEFPDGEGRSKVFVRQSPPSPSFFPNENYPSRAFPSSLYPGFGIMHCMLIWWYSSIKYKVNLLCFKLKRVYHWMGRVTNLKVFAKRTSNFKTKCPRNAESSFFMNLF